MLSQIPRGRLIAYGLALLLGVALLIYQLGIA